MNLPLSIIGRTYFVYMLLLVVQLTMLGCMLWTLLNHEDSEKKFEFTEVKSVLIV